MMVGHVIFKPVTPAVQVQQGMATNGGGGWAANAKMSNTFLNVQYGSQFRSDHVLDLYGNQMRR